jgi:hypothetical protein
MTRLVLLAMRLYPRRWRDRYGAEFEALLEDVPQRWNVTVDVAMGGLVMQTRNLKVVPAVTAIIGALAGTALWWNTPPVFAASALVSLPWPGSILEQPESEGARTFRDRLQRAIPATEARNATSITIVEAGTDSTVVRVSHIASDAISARDFVSGVVSVVVSPGASPRPGAVITAPRVATRPEPVSMAPVGVGATLGLMLGVIAVMWRRRRPGV